MVGTTQDAALDASALADKSLRGDALTRDEAAGVLRWPDADFLSLLAAVFRVRQAYFGKTVKLNFLVNIQSGLCPEDCHYCSQSKISKAPIEKYRLLSADEVHAAAKRAVANKAARLCLVASFRGPSDPQLETVAQAVRQVKSEYPELEICVSLGLLQDGQAATLRDAGVHAYNHNLNTSERYYQSICTTHTYADRVETVQRAGAAGLSPCCGAIFGMGETEEDIVDVAYRLRELEVDSIPINFLMPFEGTLLAGRQDMTPMTCLKILCLFRLLCPRAELRIAGGRELHLRSLQPLGLYIANSIFIGDYLTSAGQAPALDLEMIRDMGFEVLGDVPSNVDADAAPRLAEQVALTSIKNLLAK